MESVIYLFLTAIYPPVLSVGFIQHVAVGVQYAFNWSLFAFELNFIF